MNYKTRSQLMDETALKRTITRLAHEIIERCKGIDNVAIIGIRTRGDFLAKRIAGKIEDVEKKPMAVGVLDTAMYRDDYRMKKQLPAMETTEIPFDVDDKILVLVDDVIYTGRTIRAAMDALMDFGRPSAIQLAVLIDRGHRELPIKADYIGKSVPTARNEEVKVHMKEFDDRDEILLVEVTE